MSISKSTEYGNINISLDAVASLAGGVVTECYGVVGMASQKFVKDGIAKKKKKETLEEPMSFAELLKKENYAKGVVVRQGENGLELDLYIIVSHGIKISEVVHEAQKKVKYMMEKTLELKFSAVNVYVQGVKVMK